MTFTADVVKGLKGLCFLSNNWKIMCIIQRGSNHPVFLSCITAAPARKQKVSTYKGNREKRRVNNPVFLKIFTKTRIDLTEFETWIFLKRVADRRGIRIRVFQSSVTSSACAGRDQRPPLSNEIHRRWLCRGFKQRGAQWKWDSVDGRWWLPT